MRSAEAASVQRRVRNRRRWTAISAALIAALGATILMPPDPRFVWNASASAPVGLWRVAPAAPLRRGDMVAARLAEPWRSLAARRRYLPANVPLIKRVAAIPGDRICADAHRVTVNGHPVARPRTADGGGRAMPRWRGCTTLRTGSVLLLMDHPSSFDGRYFGPSARGDIVGKATPLWLR